MSRQERIDKYINKPVFVIFMAYLFCVLSFGRAFALLRIDTALVPLFVTECFLLFGIVLVAANLKKAFSLPRPFLYMTLVYFSYAMLYLVIGVHKGRFFVFRDVVFSFYVLFIFIAFILFYSRERLKVLLAAIMLSNIIAIFLGRVFLFEGYSSRFMYMLSMNMKPANFGLNYGITLSFLLALAVSSKKISARIALLLLASLNLYMLIMIGGRTLLISILFVFMLYTIIFRKEFLKTLMLFILVFMFSFYPFFQYDKKNIRPAHLAAVYAKLIGSFDLEKLLSLRRDINANIRKEMDVQIQKHMEADKLKGMKEKPPEPVPAAPAAKDSSWQASGTPKEIESYANLYWRLSIWKQTIAFGMESPFFGKGFGVFPVYKVWSYEYLEPTSPREEYFNSSFKPAHNQLITVFFKMGFLGLLLFLGMNIYVFFYGLKKLNGCRDSFTRVFLASLLAAFVYWHAIASFFDIIDSPPTSIFLWIITGLIFSTVFISEKERGKE